MLAPAEPVARASGACAEKSLASPANGQGEMGGVAGLEADGILSEFQYEI
jgi:hypothetical protein